MRCEFRQGVLQRDLWAHRSVSNPVPGVSISMMKPTVLALFDVNTVVKVSADALSFGLGAVLLQQNNSS